MSELHLTQKKFDGRWGSTHPQYVRETAKSS